MYKKLNLQQLKDTYSLELARYLKQEKWLEENPSKATISVNGKIPLKLFEVTISNLGLIGYEMEDRFNYYQTTKERFGEIGTFQEQVVKQLKI